MIKLIEFVNSRINPNLKIFFTLIASLLLAVCAQLTLFLAADQPDFWIPEKWLTNIGNNTSPLPGLFFYLFSGIVLISGLKRDEFFQEQNGFSVEQLQPGIIRFGFWATSFGVSLLACIYTSHGSIHDNNGYGFTFLWILSLCLYIYSVLIPIEKISHILKPLIEWVINNKFEFISVAILIFASIILRIYDLELHPYSLVNDEGEMGKGGLCILSGVCNNLFVIGWASLPIFTYLPYALSISIFSNTGFALRIVSAMAGSLSILFTYLLARELFNKKIAIISGILLCAFSLQLHFSRLAVINIIDSLSYPILLWLTLKATRTGKTYLYLLTGIFYGLAMMTYPGSRLAPIVSVILFGMIIARTPGFIKAQWRNLFILSGGAFLTFAPMGAFFFRNLEEFSARMRMEGIFQNGTLLAEAQNSGQSQLFILFVHFLKSSLIFITSYAPVQFFNTPRSYFSPIAAVFFMVGLVIVTWKWKDFRNSLLLTWFFAIIILGSTLTGGPPSSQRLLGSSPAAAIIAAVGMVILTESLGRINKYSSMFFSALLILGLGANFYQDIHFYFYEYRIGNCFEDISNEITYESRSYISQLSEQGNFYLIGEPMEYVIFGNFDFFSPNVTKENFNDVSKDSLNKITHEKDALFLAIPIRKPDLEKIQEWIPGGQWIEEKRRYHPEETLFYIYKIDRTTLDAFQP